MSKRQSKRNVFPSKGKVLEEQRGRGRERGRRRKGKGEKEKEAGEGGWRREKELMYGGK